MTTAAMVASLQNAASRSSGIRDGEVATGAASSSVSAAAVDVRLIQESLVTVTRLPSGTTALQAAGALQATVCHGRPQRSCSVELRESVGDAQRRRASSTLTFAIFWTLNSASLPSDISSKALASPTVDSTVFAAQLRVSESDVSFEQPVVQEVSAEIIVTNIAVDARSSMEADSMATNLQALTAQSLGIPADAIALAGPPRVIMPPRPPPSEPPAAAPAPAQQATGSLSSDLVGFLLGHAQEFAVGAGVLVAVCTVACAVQCLRSRPSRKPSATPIFHQRHAAAECTTVTSRHGVQRDRRRPMVIETGGNRGGAGIPNSTGLMRTLSPARLWESMPSPSRRQYVQPVIQHLSSHI